MTRPRQRPKSQFTLRSLLAGMTWLAMLIALCVGHQRASSRQRALIERLQASGNWPLFVVSGRPLPGPPSSPQEPAPR